VPYLQLDTPFSYSKEQKRGLAKRLGEIYSSEMNSNVERLTVAIRELGDPAFGAAAKQKQDRPRC
jgi:phenylpyruvate tautomerase PptA (4-oxalocrotonate tautomerase family)